MRPPFPIVSRAVANGRLAHGVATVVRLQGSPAGVTAVP